MLDFSHIKQKFLDEANTLLTNLDNALIELEKDPSNIQHTNESFRIMHTIKGASGMYGFEKVVEITHELESLYDIIRQTKIDVPQSLLELTFSAADHIRAILADEKCQIIENINRHNELIEHIVSFKNGFKLPGNQAIETNTYKTHKNSDTKSKITSWNILFFPNDEIIRRAINLVYTFQDLFQLGEYKINNLPFDSEDQQFWSIFLVTSKNYDDIEGALLFIMDYCKIYKIADYDIFNPASDAKIQESETILSLSKVEYSKMQRPADMVESSIKNLNKQKNTRINVDSSKLDTLMYLVSELVTNKSELLIALQKQNYEKANDTAEKIEKLSKLFSENAMDIRLVSLHEMLNGFKRLIRDLSKQLGKSINFVTNGEDTELDKTIIDNIGEPIMHLIRNCIDHGIESPDKRLKLGKPETGILRFDAEKSGNYVYIFISDDGNGIDTNYIYTKAIEKGFIPAGAELSQKEILDLIFLPGFSTAQSLTNISGRGVGMDIVLKKIQEIRGEISIVTNVGIGTTFTIKLQQTISIIETLLIESDGTIYAVPIEEIESCVLESSENVQDKQNKLIGYNGNLIPFINLSKNFSKEESRRSSTNEKLVIIKRLDNIYAIVADNIIGEYQAVIKPLGNAFKHVRFLSGASLLGDGSIALLLDTDKLWSEIDS